MNNEDKILEVLYSMQNQMGTLENKMGTLENKVGIMQNQINGLSNKVDNLADRITSVELHLENVTDKNLGILLEQYNPNVERLSNLEIKVDEMQVDLNAVKRVVISHSKDINELMNR